MKINWVFQHYYLSVQFRCTTLGFPLSLGFKNDAMIPYRVCTNGILHLDAPATEKIRIDFIDETLIGFGLIWSLLFSMAHIATCNCTIVFFRIDFPKSKWAEESSQIICDLEAWFQPFVFSLTSNWDNSLVLIHYLIFFYFLLSK